MINQERMEHEFREITNSIICMKAGVARVRRNPTVPITTDSKEENTTRYIYLYTQVIWPIEKRT